MIDAIILWGSLLMVGISVMVFALIMDWRENRHSKAKKRLKGRLSACHDPQTALT